MSIFMPLTVTCPNCGEDFDVDIVESVNADRRPDLRDEILAGTFQVVPCGNCGEDVRLDPMFNYLDIGRSQWISVQPAEKMRDWIGQEDTALEVFSVAYGAQSSGNAREIGKELSPRLVFGWPALREKLWAQQLGLDDLALELTKLILFEEFGVKPMAQGAELRLLGGDEDTFDMGWIVPDGDRIIDGMTVPMEMYQGVISNLGDWSEASEQLSSGPFVDVLKLFIGQGRSADADVPA